jgi:membrane protease YdiL (CAAX protease family)
MAQSYARANIARIRSVPWSGWNALVAFLVPWIVLPLAVLVTIEALAPHISGVAWFEQAFTSANPDPRASFALVLVDAAGSFAIIGYYLRKHHASMRDLGIRRFSPGRAILLLIALLVAFSLLIGVVYALVALIDPSFNANQPQTNEFTGTTSSLSLWALVIIPPFVEETVFRGFMFPAFSKRFGVVIGAILTSVLFGFAHLQGNVSVYTFILSLILCFLYVRLNSIIPGIGLHMLNNYIAYMGLHQK